MKLKPELAQSIVDQMMKKIPYNINMMDQNGYIIASGDKSRLNTLHVGALDAIKQRKTLTMSKDHGSHGLPGVNMPLFFEKKIIGVVGITGDPEKVLPLASLLEVATELLLNQSQVDKFKKEQHERLNRFIYRWVQVDDNLESHTDLILEANQLKINVNLARYVVVIHSIDKPLPVLYQDADDYSLSLSANTSLILTHQASSLERLKKLVVPGKIFVGISQPTNLIGQDTKQAFKTIELARSFSNPNYIHYTDIAFIDKLIAGQLPLSRLTTKFSELDKTESGDELIQTIIAYIQHNGNIVQTSKYLHIHRNTLNYRLTKINDFFTLNPHNIKDLFQLYLGYIYFTYEQNDFGPIENS